MWNTSTLVLVTSHLFRSELIDAAMYVEEIAHANSTGTCGAIKQDTTKKIRPYPGKFPSEFHQFRMFSCKEKILQ